MNKIVKFLLPLALFIIVVGFLFKGLYLDPHEVPSPLVGKPAPSFTAPVLAETGKTFSSQDMKGKVWLLNVWASWCGACREEHPVLMDMSKLSEIEMVGLDYKDTDAEAKDILNAAGNPYKRVVTDADGRIGINYGVYGVPETYLIDKVGVIRYKQIGPITKELLYTKILPMVKELQR